MILVVAKEVSRQFCSDVTHITELWNLITIEITIQFTPNFQ